MSTLYGKTYIGISVVVLVSTIIIYVSKPSLFNYFFSTLNPVIIVSALCVLGYILLRALGGYGYTVFSSPMGQRLRLIFFSVVLAVLIILVDLTVVLPEDINVGLPYSLLYYPVFGFVVEVLFHLLPLYILLSMSKKTGHNFPDFLLLGFVSLLEPVFQLGLGFSSQVPGWAALVIGVNIFLINVAQLNIFNRYDFVSMYSFRLLYYLCWHIIWGQLRLGVLF